MENPFFDRPIINSPYQYPSQHWELDEDGQPTQGIIESRRGAEFVTPIPKPKQRGRARGGQQQFVIDEGLGLSTQEQQYDVTAAVNEIRRRVDEWRNIPGPDNLWVTPETARLLLHWRQHKFSHYRPFFCQVEAVETLIWLTEVAPRLGMAGRGVLDRLADVNNEANPGLSRIALKLATGAGKTTVMAMIIAWQTINAVRHPNSRRFTRGFLVVTPGLTIKDRLRVLQPNDPDSYYASRELVPGDMLEDLRRGKIVITNYHALRLRERLEVSKEGRKLLEGPGGALETLETEGQMVQRVMPELMGMKGVMVLNDEGHHCYRQKPGDDDEGPLNRDDRQEADRNNEEARVWISGLEMVKRKLGIPQVVDLSATPFFLRGSGYAEGTLFPWTVSDFSLMDAIECGIVKLPRVPVRVFRLLSCKQSEHSESTVWLPCNVPDGRCDVGSAEQSEDVYHDVSQSCHDLWRRSGPYLRAVLSHRHVPHIVQAVLYSPVAAYQLEQPISRCARSEAGDSVSHLPGQLVFDPTPTLHLHYLPMSGPVQICLQHVCGPQPAKLPTVCMPAHRLSIGVLLSGHRSIKAQLYVLIEALLVGLDYKQIVSALSYHLLTQPPLTVQSISRQHPVCHPHSLQQSACHAQLRLPFPGYRPPF